MKKVCFILLLLLLTSSLFSQFKSEVYLIDGKDIGTKYENRKKRGYYNSIQMNMLMGNKQFSERVYYFYPYWTSDHFLPSSSYYIPRNNTPNTQIKMAVSPSVTVTNGYMFNERFSMGVGVGFEIFDHNLFPLFADIKYTFWDNKVSPFIAIKGGYAFGNFKMKHHDEVYLNWSPYYLSDAHLRHYGGLMVHPEVGVKMPLNQNCDLLFTAAYRYQKIKSVARQNYDSSYFDEWEHKEDISRLSFGIGIMFR